MGEDVGSTHVLAEPNRSVSQTLGKLSTGAVAASNLSSASASQLKTQRLLNQEGGVISKPPVYCQCLRARLFARHFPPRSWVVGSSLLTLEF